MWWLRIILQIELPCQKCWHSDQSFKIKATLKCHCWSKEMFHISIRFFGYNSPIWQLVLKLTKQIGQQVVKNYETWLKYRKIHPSYAMQSSSLFHKLFLPSAFASFFVFVCDCFSCFLISPKPSKKLLMDINVQQPLSKALSTSYLGHCLCKSPTFQL